MTLAEALAADRGYLETEYINEVQSQRDGPRYPEFMDSTRTALSQVMQMQAAVVFEEYRPTLREMQG